MKKSLIITVGVVAALGAAWLATTAYIAQRVSTEMSRFEALLTARDDVRVTRFDYDAGFFSGELIYDLSWRPTLDQEIYPELFDTADFDLPLAGSLQVDHGPWLGTDGFALGRARQRVEAPAELRELLPQYPGQQPVLTISSVLGFDGALSLRLRAIDYDGSVVIEGSAAELTVAGLGADIDVDRDLRTWTTGMVLDQVLLQVPQAELLLELSGMFSNSSIQTGPGPAWRSSFDAGLESLRMEGPDGVAMNLSDYTVGGTLSAPEGTASLLISGPAAFDVLQLDFRLAELHIPVNSVNGQDSIRMDGLYMLLDLQQDESTALLGPADLGLASLALDLPQNDVQATIRGLALNSNTQRLDDQVDNYLSMNLEGVNYNGQDFGELVFEASLLGINIGTWVVIDKLSGDEELDDLLPALERLAADQLSLNVDRFEVALFAPQDITADLNLDYQGSPQLDWQSGEELLAAISMQSQLRVSILAVEQFLENLQLEPQLAANYRDMLQQFYELPYVTLDGGYVTSAATIEQGVLSVNGEPTMDLAELLPMLSDDSGAAL